MAKSKYEDYVKPRFDEIRQWVKKGYSQAQIIKKLGVGKTTFEKYKNENSELSELLSDSKKERDIIDLKRTEKALMKCIEGGWVTNGDKTYYVPPNVTAIMFALKKLNAKTYGDNSVSKNEGIDGITVNFVTGGNSDDPNN